MGNQLQTILVLQDLEERQCIATRANDLPCYGKIRVDEHVHVSNKLLSLHSLVNEEERTTALHTIIKQLLCKEHREKQSAFQLKDMLGRHKSEMIAFSKSQKMINNVISRPWKGNSRSSVRSKLQSTINEKQSQEGFIYAFTVDINPGFVKIGWAKGCVEKRCKTWAKCYPGATLCFWAAFDFPQRMEELIHLELADTRCEIKCGSCKSEYHNEWFKGSIESAKAIIEEWKVVCGDFRLYDRETWQLTKSWREIIQGAAENDDIKITAAALMKLKALREKAPGSAMFDTFAELALNNNNQSL